MDQLEPMNLIQTAPDGLEAEAPLVLIHDGGGTIVSYFYLESQDRALYAIQNPRFYSGEEWEGGLPEMAREYAKMIKSEIRSGPILLGGWSLGGLLSLEIASILERSSDIHVLGIVMIDSIFPLAVDTNAANIVPSEPIFGISTKPEMRERVSQCMTRAFAMVKRWIPPVWKGCNDPELYRQRTRLEDDLTAKLGAGSSTNATAAKPGNAGMDSLPSPPQAVLLRCTDYVPVPKTDIPNAVARVDVVREREQLGWEDYKYDFITAVLDIPGHHFNIFTDDYLDDVSTRIKIACKMLERVSL